MQDFGKEFSTEFKRVINSLGYQIEDLDFDLTKDISYGDICTNIALQLGSKYNIDSKTISKEIAKNIRHPNIKEVKAEDNGFINIILSEQIFLNYYENLLHKKENIGKLEIKRGGRYMEIISANPTGYLHIGHTRNGIYSDTLSNIFEYRGYYVKREYLVNNAGSQIKDLIESIWTKWRIKADKIPLHISTNLKYQGSDIDDCFQYFWTKNKNNWFMEEDKNLQLSSQYPQISKEIINWFLNEIKQDLHDYEIKVDSWKYEQELVSDKNVNMIFREIDEYIQYKNKAIWMNYEEKSEVLIKADGHHTYLLQDMVYHKYKLMMLGEKDEIINILGSDHYGHVNKLNTFLKILKIKPEKVKFVCVQLVRLNKDDKSVKMSKRDASVIFMRDLKNYMNYEEVRWFFASQSPNSTLEINLEKLKMKDYNNPIYYVMYAYSRISKILNKTEDNYEVKNIEFKNLTTKEREIWNFLLFYESTLESSINNLVTHHLTQYLFRLSQLFHTYYEETNIINSKKEAIVSKLALLYSIKNTIKSGLKLLKIDAQENL